jgi:hypothetical protein
MSFCRQDLPEAIAERCPQVFGLACFLSDNQRRHGLPQIVSVAPPYR